jgi:hypothetical protein
MQLLWNVFLNQVPLLHIACEKADLNLATVKMCMATLIVWKLYWSSFEIIKIVRNQLQCIASSIYWLCEIKAWHFELITPIQNSLPSCPTKKGAN